jgi:hypothetical protein
MNDKSKNRDCLLGAEPVEGRTEGEGDGGVNGQSILYAHVK